jgi:LacI family transcriptional regulator
MRNASSNSFTLRDVARLAGVSVATVSAVLNKKGTVGAESKRRVEEVMSQLDYHPDTLAQGLKTGRSHVVGLVVPDITNLFYTEAMGGLEAMARSRGYSVILSNSNEDPKQELENLDLLHSRRVDGVVLACSSGHVAYDRLTMRRFPIVFMDRLPSAGFSGRAVIVDNAGAAHTATNHLIGLGHVKIAIIAGRLDLSVGAGRLAGFRAAMQEARLPIRESYLQEGDFHPESGYQCGMRLMALPEPPTAIFACNNSMTLGLMRALAECQAPCPEQVSVLAFDDFPWAAHFRPQLTAVAQPVFELGWQAMRMLLAAMEPESPEAAEIKDPLLILKAELRVRQSTAPPPAP